MDLTTALTTAIAWFTVNPFSTFVLVLSTTGAILVSGKSQRLRFYGFAVWVVSNGLIAYDYYGSLNIPMVILFGVFYQVCNLRGAWHNRKW